MSNKLELKKLILETKDGKKKIELTVEEARELHTQLESLFGRKVDYIPPSFTSPIIMDQPWYPGIYPEPYKITWGTSGDPIKVYGDNINVSYCCSEVNE